DVVKILLEKLQADDVSIRAAAATNLGELKPEGAPQQVVIDALMAAYKRGERELRTRRRRAGVEDRARRQRLGRSRAGSRVAEKARSHGRCASRHTSRPGGTPGELRRA